MSTPPRIFSPDLAYHVYNRSAGQKIIFHNGADYERFIYRMRDYQEKFPVEILAYCLMPNHFHLMLRPAKRRNDPAGSLEPGGSRHPENPENPENPEGPRGPSGFGHGFGQDSTEFLHRLFTSYAKYYDYHHEEHSGRVFQGTYKAKPVTDDAYYFQLMAYIHDNPVRKKLVTKPEEWPYSSYPALTLGTLRVDSTLRVEPAPESAQLDHKKIYHDFLQNRAEVAEQVREWLWL